MKTLNILFLILVVVMQGFPQSNRLFATFELPVQYSIGYNYQFSEKFSGNVQLGLLTEPNTSVILSTLEAFGTDESITLLIEDAFESGTVIELGANYHWSKSYGGLFFQRIIMSGDQTPIRQVELVTGRRINAFPRIGINTNTPEIYVLLESSISQMGVLYGRRFDLTTHSELCAEIAISAHISSTTSVESDVRNIDTLSQQIDEILTETYRNYAYIPSLTVGYAFRF
jgi:hypothetical protein